MSTKPSQEVTREPWSYEADVAAVEDQFQFHQPTTLQQETLASLRRMGLTFAIELANTLPEGTAKQVAINNVMGALLWAQQSLTHRQVEVIVAVPCKLDTDGDGNCPVHPEGCPVTPKACPNCCHSQWGKNGCRNCGWTYP